MKLTDDQIFTAADELVAEGEKATVAAVRAYLGRGSLTTITKALKTWREARKTSNDSVPSAPDNLVSRFTSLANGVWRDAYTAAELVFKGEKDALESQMQEQATELEAMTRIADAANEKIEEQEAALESLNASLKSETDSRSKAEQANALLEQQVESLKQTISKLEADRESIRERADKDKGEMFERIETLRGERDALEQQHQEQSAELDVANAKLKEQESELKSALATRTQAEQSNALLEQQVQSLKETISKLETEREAIRERADKDRDEMFAKIEKLLKKK